jgi:transcriptional regulator with XRE-family HTH domain
MMVLEENATVGEKIRFYRNKRHMLGNTLADNTGMSRHAIMDYEAGTSEPLLEDLQKIATAPDVEVDKLYDEYYKFLAYPYSQKVKELRKEKKLLQRELGDMLGVTRRAVERWEHGINKVKRETWEKLRILKLL